MHTSELTTAIFSPNEQSIEQRFDNLNTRYQLFLKNSAGFYWEWDITKNSVSSTDEWKRALGKTYYKNGQAIEEWTALLHPDDAERVLRTLKRHLKGELNEYVCEYRIQHQSGHYLHIRDTGHATFNRDGSPEFMFGNCINITDKVANTEKLKQTQKRLSTILSCMSEGVLVFDLNEKITYTNENVSRLVGLKDKQLEGLHATEVNLNLFRRNGKPFLPETFPTRYTIETGRPMKNVIMGVFYHNKFTWFLLNCQPMFEEDSKEIIGAVLTIADVTEKQNTATQIRQLAFNDHLTGLPNKIDFEKQLKKRFEAAHSEGKESALLIIDVDHFKWINDSVGHKFGDHLLKLISKRLKSLKRPQDYLARIQGDEFVVILEDINDNSKALQMAQLIVDALQQQFLIHQYKLNVKVSIGIRLFNDRADTIESIIKNAESAMYKAKEKGRNRVELYHDRLTDKIKELHQINNALEESITKNQLSVFFQPQINSENNTIVAAEALIRWQHPKLGFVSPAKFIAIAEESGMIIPIGKWLIERVCATLSNWQQQGLPLVPVAINLSAKQFVDSQLAMDIKNALNKYGIPAKHLHLEITESVLANQDLQTMSNINELSQMGLSFSIDDFGTGYSSLSYLKHFKMDFVKIDKSFIDNINHIPADRVITKTIIDLAKNMSLGVIAEGVETKLQLATVNALGCHLIQGYFYSKPLPESEFIEFIKTNINA